MTSYLTILDRIHFGYRNRRAPLLYNATFSLLTGTHLRCTIQSHSLHFTDVILTEFLQIGQSFCEDFATSIFQRIVNAYSKYGGINAIISYFIQIVMGGVVNYRFDDYIQQFIIGWQSGVFHSIVYFLELLTLVKNNDKK